MSQYKLTYFDAMAMGEPIRYMLSYMGKEFEDNRIPLYPLPNFKTMPNIPYGKIPTLEIDSKILHQSGAIMRYLAQEAGLAGNNVNEYLEIDMIFGAFIDLQSDISRYFKTQNQNEKEKLKESIINEIFPFYFEKFQNVLEKNGGYLANGKLSWVDFFVVAYCESFPGLMGINLPEKYSAFQELRNKVHSLPGIKEWIQKRPQTEI